MAKLTKEEFISALKEMTILEVKELVDAMKEEFGIDPTAVAAAPAKKAAVPAKKTAATTAPVAQTVLAPQAAWPFPTGNKP